MSLPLVGGMDSSSSSSSTGSDPPQIRPNSTNKEATPQPIQPSSSSPKPPAEQPDENINPRKRKTPPLPPSDDEADADGDEDAEGDADVDMESDNKGSAAQQQDSEYERGYIKCPTCHQDIPFRKTGQICLDDWNAHKKECHASQTTGSNDSSLRRPKPTRSATPPHRSPRQLPQDPILYTPITHGHGPPTKRRRAKRTEEERIEYLKSDPYVAQFEAYRVLCASCDKWIRLRPNSTYCSIPWDAHRKSCLAKKISTKNTYALEERNSLFSKDPDVRKFDAERVLCAECDQWVAINPEDHLQAVQRWLAHKSSCQKITRRGGPGMPYVMHSPEFPPHPSTHGQRSPNPLPPPLRLQASPSLAHPTIAAVRRGGGESPPPHSRRASISVSAPTTSLPPVQRDEKPPRRPSSESPIPPSTSRSPLVSPTTSEAALDGTGKDVVPGSPTSTNRGHSPRDPSSSTNVDTSPSLSIQDSRRRNAEQRAATLRADPLISKVEANRVFCSLCQKWVQLRQDSSFCAYPWVQHRGKCVGRYQRRAQKAAEIAEIKARKASAAASASSATSPGIHHREYYVQQPYPPSHAYPPPPPPPPPSHSHTHASSSRYPPSHAYPSLPPPPPPPPPTHHRYSRYDDRDDDIDSEEEDMLRMKRYLDEKRYSAPPPRYPYSRRPAPYPPPPHHPHSRAAAAYPPPPPPLSRNGSYRSQRRVPPLPPPLPPPPPPPRPHADEEEEEDQLHSDPDESDADGSPDPEVPDTRDHHHRDGDIRMASSSSSRRTTTTTTTRFDLSNPTARNRFIHHSIHHLFSSTFSLSEDELSVSTLLAYLNAAMPEGRWEDFDTGEVVRAVVGFRDVGRERVELEGDLIRVKG